jgi:hypothetical protein
MRVIGGRYESACATMTLYLAPVISDRLGALRLKQAPNRYVRHKQLLDFSLKIRAAEAKLIWLDGSMQSLQILPCAVNKLTGGRRWNSCQYIYVKRSRKNYFHSNTLTPSDHGFQ